MRDIELYFTADGSVGLYDNKVCDIYHSANGALSEAIDKFIMPIDFSNLLLKDNINILDLCYGVGYNTKAFLNFIVENVIINKNFSKKIFKHFSSLNQNICAIHTDNNYDKLSPYNYEIYTNNIFKKITINAVETNKNLFIISPLLKTCEKKWFKINNKLNYNLHADSKFLLNNNKVYPRLNPLVNFYLLKHIYKYFGNDAFNKLAENFIFNKSNQVFLTPHLLYEFSKIINKRNIYAHILEDYSFLHNIYYKYLSKRYKINLECLKLDNLKFVPINMDAREFILQDKTLYDIIFLDAFTPTKCPCLWTYDFIHEVYNHMSDDGILLTYSTSASVRNAMISSGFYIGNNIKSNNIIGTIATKKASNIKYKLSEYDLGLLKTRAGIFYRDPELNASNVAIIEARKKEAQNSNKISTTRYKRLNYCPK